MVQEALGFEDGITYYTLDDGIYNEVDSNSRFIVTKDYYIKENGNYILKYSKDTTYYTVGVDNENNLYFKPITSITFTTGKTYYVITPTAINNLESFNKNVVYYERTGSDSYTYTQVFNPLDYLEMNIIRENVNDVSTLKVSYKTLNRIYNYGYGITYIKINKSRLHVINISYVEE